MKSSKKMGINEEKWKNLTNEENKDTTLHILQCKHKNVPPRY